MKKTNWIIAAILVVASIFFLALWYFLGFNLVDDPLDLVLTIIWWAVVIVACVTIHVAEKKRQERMRTAYLGQGVLFNPEAGLVNTSQAPSQVDALQNILENMEYPMSLKDFPNLEALSLDFIVRTTKFEAQVKGDTRPTWEGDVSFVHVPNREPVRFKNRNELSRILNCMPA